MISEIMILVKKKILNQSFPKMAGNLETRETKTSVLN